MKQVLKAALLIRFAHEFKEFTRKEFMDFTGFHRDSAEKIFTFLHNGKMVYVIRYTEDPLGRMNVAVYAWGNRHDAPRIPLRGTERQKLMKRRKQREAQDI